MSVTEVSRPSLTPTVLALSGNPRPGSRTLGVARALAGRIAREIGAPDAVASIDLAEIGPELLAPEHPAADAALAQVRAAGVLVVATPVYKASYTGLLKAFLDLLGPDALAGVVAVPLVVSGSPAHALVGEVHLRPVLVELGALLPTRALTVTESELPRLDDAVDRWWSGARTPLLRSLGAVSSRTDGPPSAPSASPEPLAAVAR